MNQRVIDCFKIAEDTKAEELFIKANQDITMRVGRDLVPLKKMGSPQLSMREFVSEILNEEEKKNLYENLKVTGQKTIGNLSFKFDFQIDFDGISGALTMGETFKKNWNFPNLIGESLGKGFGLNFVFGSRRSGKTTAINELLGLLPKKQRVVALYTDDESVQYSCEGNILFSFPISHISQNGVHPSADLIVFETKSLNYVQLAVELAEGGQQVIHTLPFMNLEMGLQRVLDLIDSSSREVSARRLASVLQMAIGLRLVKNLEESKTGIIELLINDQKIKPIILSQKMNLLYKAMKEGAEGTGMRTFNHSLFQLMLKRKIDFRTAFEISEDPEELDALLKKIGI